MSGTAYKANPLWADAIALAHEAYRIAERARGGFPALARHLRKAAVSVPAHIAGALSADGERPPSECIVLARGALAEVQRQALRLRGGLEAEGGDLTARARRLERRLGDLPSAGANDDSRSRR